MERKHVYVADVQYNYMLPHMTAVSWGARKLIHLFLMWLVSSCGKLEWLVTNG